MHRPITVNVSTDRNSSLITTLINQSGPSKTISTFSQHRDLESKILQSASSLQLRCPMSVKEPVSIQRSSDCLTSFKLSRTDSLVPMYRSIDIELTFPQTNQHRTSIFTDQSTLSLHFHRPISIEPPFSQTNQRLAYISTDQSALSLHLHRPISVELTFPQSNQC